MAILAFSNVRLASSWRHSDNELSLMPTTSQSLIISPFSVPKLRETAKLYRTAMYCSGVSPSSWIRQLKRACSKISFFSLGKSVELPQHGAYTFRSSFVMFVDFNTSSASSPRQYNNMHTWQSASLVHSPEATRNCSNLLLQLGHSSGHLQLKHWKGRS